MIGLPVAIWISFLGWVLCGRLGQALRPNTTSKDRRSGYETDRDSLPDLLPDILSGVRLASYLSHAAPVATIQRSPPELAAERGDFGETVLADRYSVRYG